jgi:hypothetical protein
MRQTGVYTAFFRLSPKACIGAGFRAIGRFFIYTIRAVFFHFLPLFYTMEATDRPPRSHRLATGCGISNRKQATASPPIEFCKPKMDTTE